MRKRHVRLMTADAARELSHSWQLTLLEQRRAGATRKSYESSVLLYLAWCEQHERAPAFDAEMPMLEWLAELADPDRGNRSGRTVNARLAGLRSFTGWLTAEGEISADGAALLRPAAVDQHIPPAITPAQRDLILAACAADRSWYGIRDEAMFSLMFDAMIRANETLSMRSRGDLDLRARRVHVRRGKGAKERIAPFSPATARRVDRYQRHRRHSRHAELPAMWLSRQGALSYKGLYNAYQRRAQAAGIDGTFPHALRAGGAVEWRRKGGRIDTLMSVAGWRDAAMALHYTQIADLEIALAEGDRLFES